MPVRNTVIGQHVDETKALRAKELRRNPTPEERLLWQRLRANRLGGFHFRRQQPIAGFIVDFYCHAAALVVEVDGEIHQNQIEADAERDRALNSLGYRVIRFTNEDIWKRMQEVLGKTLEACRAAHLSPPAPLP
jgi:very-short-patch-repair endonuclease